MPSFLSDDLAPDALHKLLIGSVQPRPIALVSTISEKGTPNLAPYSFFNIASSNPPILAFSAQLAPEPSGTAGRAKDTLTNIRDTGECVVHIVSFDLRERMNTCAAPWPSETNEFDFSGLTTLASLRVRAPRAAEAHVAFECVLDQIISWSDKPRSGNLVLVRVVAVHVGESVYRDGKIDQWGIDSIGRMGGATYVRTRDALFEMPQPDQAWVDRQLAGADRPA